MNIWTFYFQRGHNRFDISEYDTPNYWSHPVSKETLECLDSDSEALAASIVRDALGEGTEKFYSNIRDCYWEYYGQTDEWIFTFDVDVDVEGWENHNFSELVNDGLH